MGNLRYLMFAISLFYVVVLFLIPDINLENVMFWSFIVGNLIYYASGICLAYKFKDNRAFCKYLCPITVFLKPASYFSLLRIKVDKEKCTSCMRCKKACPMEVDMLDPSRKRKNATECILCLECVRHCNSEAIRL